MMRDMTTMSWEYFIGLSALALFAVGIPAAMLAVFVRCHYRKRGCK